MASRRIPGATPISSVKARGGWIPVAYPGLCLYAAFEWRRIVTPHRFVVALATFLYRGGLVECAEPGASESRRGAGRICLPVQSSYHQSLYCAGEPGGLRVALDRRELGSAPSARKHSRSDGTRGRLGHPGTSSHEVKGNFR